MNRAPQFPIAAVLREMGVDVEDVHHGYKKVLCVWHPDTNPSASVGRYSYICWSCGKKGDAIKIVREEWDLSHADAVRRCAEITGTEGAAVSGKSRWSDVLPG